MIVYGRQVLQKLTDVASCRAVRRGCRTSRAGLIAACLAFWAGADPLAAEEPKPQKQDAETAKFIRLKHNDDSVPLSLQTAVVDYQSAKPELAGVTVSLVGAVHVGEKAYYEKLNELFGKYDAVLYEMVAPEGTVIPKGGKPGGNPVSAIQNGMKDMLHLEHQLQCIDYTQANMVHADMSPDGFAQSMKDRGESIWQMLMRALAHGLAAQASGQQKSSFNEIDMLMALLDPDRSTAMKKILAEQFEDLEGMMAALDGPDGSTLISERNKVAIKELKTQLAAGKKRVAIFYGAAHLNDMQHHLGDDFGLKRSGETWLTAWDLTSTAPKKRQRKSKTAEAGQVEAAPAGTAGGAKSDK